MSLGDLLLDAVGQLDDVETTLTPDGAITWSRAQRPFAVLAADGASADFGLDPAVASSLSVGGEDPRLHVDRYDPLRRRRA